MLVALCLRKDHFVLHCILGIYAVFRLPLGNGLLEKVWGDNLKPCRTIHYVMLEVGCHALITTQLLSLEM